LRKSNNKSRIELYRAVLSVRGINECADFLGDLLTENELDVINQRFRIAKMLTMGISYAEISEVTGASTATISRANRALLYGNGGYAKIFERMLK